MNNNEENRVYIYPMWSKEMKSSLSGVTSVIDAYQSILKTVPSTQITSNIAGTLSRIKPSYASIFDNTGIKPTVSALSTININSLIMSNEWASSVKSICNSTSLLKDVAASMSLVAKNYSEILSAYQRMLEQIESMPEEEIEAILGETEYTTEDVLEDINQFRQEMSETSNVDSTLELPEDRVNEFLKNHPALAHILYVINIIILVISGVQDVKDFVLPMAQNAIVTMQGNEDIFFIKVESAKLYIEPSSHSVTIMNIPYGEPVVLIESINLWDKVSYINQDSKEVVGWIAKRNLMTYQDYEFNSDDLYDLE